MKHLASEIDTFTHPPFIRGRLSGRVADLRLFAVLCLFSGLAVCMFWISIGNATGAVGGDSYALVSASGHEGAPSTTLAEFVDHLLHRSGIGQNGDEIPSSGAEQLVDVSAAEDDTHKAFGLTVSFELLVSSIEEVGSKYGFVFTEPNVTIGVPVTLLRGPPHEK